MRFSASFPKPRDGLIAAFVVLASTNAAAQSDRDNARQLEDAFERLAEKEQIEDPAEDDSDPEADARDSFDSARLASAEATLGVMAVGLVPLVTASAVAFAFGPDTLSPVALGVMLAGFAVFAPLSSVFIVLAGPLWGIYRGGDPEQLLKSSWLAWLGPAVSASAVPVLMVGALWAVSFGRPPPPERQLAAILASPWVEFGGPMAFWGGLAGMWTGTMVAGGLAVLSLRIAEEEAEEARQEGAPPSLEPPDEP